MPNASSGSVAAICVMGVSGCGKTSVAQRLAAERSLRFVEGDLLHPAANVTRMAAGTPLTDDDRWPWLDAIGMEIRNALDRGEGLVVSCSALKRVYRDRLRQAAGGRLDVVYLHGTREVLLQRMAAREGHFMPVSLLDSQLRTLEVPTGEAGVVTVDIDAPLAEIVAKAEKGLQAL